MSIIWRSSSELNVLCPLRDFSPQSDQPLMKHLTVEIAHSTSKTSG